MRDRTLHPVFGLGATVAHQGGWDEALLVAVPMVVVTWLLWLAKRRVRRAERVSAAGGEQREDGGDG